MMLRSAARFAARARHASSKLPRASSCVLPTEFTPLPLLAKERASHDSDVYTFGLPVGRSLDLPVCGCILLRAPGRGRAEGAGAAEFDGTDAVRPYTPISDNAMTGQFQLLVKRYQHGAVSEYLHGLLPGFSEVDFKHIKFNVKEQYPFPNKEHITMLCAGTGVTPMYQALHKLLGTPGDNRKVVLLVGNRSPADILLKPELDAWAAAHPTRLKVVHVVGERADEPPPPGWASTETYVAESGHVDEAKIARYAAPPDAGSLVFVCGTPAMYESLCGPRGEKGLAEGSTLQRLGYTTEMVVKM